MQQCRHYYNIILLLVLLVVGPVRSVPEEDAKNCQDETEELYRNSFGIVEQVGDLASWTEDQRSNPESTCTHQSEFKTTCILDYVNATDSPDWCLDVPDTLYVETNFIYKCSNNNNKKIVFYTIQNKPACYSSNCYDGYDSSVLESLERATFDWLTSELQNPNTDSEWGDTTGYDTCVQMRLTVTDPILSEAVAAPEGIDENFSFSSTNTTSSPTTSSAPTSSPTTTQSPTTSLAPTKSPMELSCKDESDDLVSSSNSGTTLQVQGLRSGSSSDQNSRNEIVEGLTNIQDLMMIDPNTGKGFEKHCKTIAVDDTNSNTENVTALCEFDYGNFLAATTNTEDSIAALCRTANGVYVEDSVSITCTSVEDSAEAAASMTRLIVKNKPSCRSKTCNADGVREVATIEFDRWMKMTLEKGMEEAFADDADGAMASILGGLQSCVIDDNEKNDEKGVVVAVGGSSLSNVGGEPIQPTDECQAFTDAVYGNLNIYNEKIVLQREILNYVDTDMREICGSTEQNTLACHFDWSEVAVSSPLASETDADALKSVCMPDGSGDSGAGQYVESSFKVSCVGAEGKKLTMTNTNVPGCVGRPCTPGQSQYLFEDDYTFLADKFIEEGWSCSTEILSVYEPHYDAFFGTYNIDDIGSNPQFNEIAVDEVSNYPDVDTEDLAPKVSRNNIIVVDVPTPAPTGRSVVNSLKYGSLFETEAPTPGKSVTIDVDLYASSSSARFSGTWTILLLLPMAMSILIIS